jgi:hypothetical protein
MRLVIGSLALSLWTGSACAQMLGTPLVSTSAGGIVNGTNVYARTVSATVYYGDGSQLTGVTGGSSDRITSGTLSAVANGGNGYVSLSTAGTTWGYLNSGESYLPQLGVGSLSARGDITATGTVSTTGLVVGDHGFACANATRGAVRYNTINNTLQACNSSGWTNLQASNGPVAFSDNKNGHD